MPQEPPNWRQKFMVPDPLLSCSGVKARNAAALTDGMISAMPDRATTMNKLSVQKDVFTSAPLIRKFPSANRLTPTITIIWAGKRSTSRPNNGVPEITRMPAGTRRNPAKLAENPCTSWTKIGIM